MMAPATTESIPQTTPVSEPRAKSDSIAGTIHHTLSQSSYRALHQIRCDYSQGVLTLHGRVPSYYLKQLALEIAKRIARGKVINNVIQVVPPQF